MATLSDTTVTTLSGLNYIDALLKPSPNWNLQTGGAANTVLYSFSISSGIQSSAVGLKAFSAAQQNYARQAMQYLSDLTGIKFVETTSGSAAQIHFGLSNLDGSDTIGLCSSGFRQTNSGGILTSYDADAYVYLDNVEWLSYTNNLAPGGIGYEVLLHELGHALGLKHPFDGDINLPAAQDNTNYTLMSYTSAGGNHQTYSPYDIAALNWLYGKDGLGGAYGVNSASGGRYITGTSGADTLSGGAAADMLEGDGGDDYLIGGGGSDTAVFRGARSAYTITLLPNGDLLVGGGSDGLDVLSSIELLQFSDGVFQSESLVTTFTALTGSAGADRLLARDGNDAIDGLDGVDTVVYAGKRANFTVADGGGRFTVSDLVGNGGVDTLSNVERIVFADRALALDINGIGGQAYRLYQAAFNRAPDAAGLGYWIKALDGGLTLAATSANFMASAEFSTLYGSNLSDQAFVTKLYNNALHRAPEAAGMDYWLNVLQVQHVARADVLVYFSESAENQAQVIGVIQHGMDYIPFV